MKKENFLGSKFFRIWSELSDGLAVNLLFLITCIPIVTYGPAKTALYETAVKWVKREDAGGKEYWASFRANLRTAIVPGIIVMVIGVLVYLDYRITAPGTWLRIITYILLVFVYTFKEQLFLVNARLRCSLGQLLRNGLFMALRNPVRTIAGALLWLIPVIVLFNDPGWFARTAVIWIFAYYAFCAWITVKLTNKDYLELFRTVILSEDNREEIL